MLIKNYESTSILFNTICLITSYIDFNSTKFFVYDEYARLYLDTCDLTNFLKTWEPYNISECIIEIDFEPYFLVDCSIEITNSIFYYQNGSLVKKPNAWNLDLLNIEEDNLYTYDDTNKDLVELWILDTGINWRHTELNQSKVIDIDPTFTISNLTHPHGTGTAICAAGLNYGSSKNFTIYNYPVCRVGASCRSSDVDNGLKLITDRLENNIDAQGNFIKRIVINLSIGNDMGKDPTDTGLGLYYNHIFQIINERGGIIVTSAGNSNQDACTWLYSFSPYVISVGALERNYNKASFSNYGSCVDMWTFGVSVPTGYSISDKYLIQFKSGTSFSSPLIAGLVANILSQNIKFSRDEILQILYYQFNNFTVPRYKCNELIKQCCQSQVKGTRKDKYCRSLGINYCDRSCNIKEC